MRVGAQRWLQETGLKYDMLLDSNRQIYRATGMGRTVAGVWNTRVLTYYTEQLLANKRLPEDFDGVKDDKEQMGGDIILDKTGRYALIHVSQESTDRPSVDKLIHVIKNIDGPTHSNGIPPSASSTQQ